LPQLSEEGKIYKLGKKPYPAERARNDRRGAHVGEDAGRLFGRRAKC
jgi:hypothetical protein